MMNSTNVNETNNRSKENSRILWVGNLHPKVTSRHIAELFYQVGPIEYAQMVLADERSTYLLGKIAWVLFKHPSSVNYSIKLFRGTKLYGIPIITKNFSKHHGNLTIHEQLNYFKLLVNEQLNKHSNSYRYTKTKRCIGQSSGNNRVHMRESYTHKIPCTNTNNLYNDTLLDSMTVYDHMNKSTWYQHRNLYTDSHNPIDNSNHRRELSQNSKYYSSYSSMKLPINNKVSYHNEYIDCKHQDYNVHISSNQKGNMHHSKKLIPLKNENYFANDVLPVCDNIKDAVNQTYCHFNSNNCSHENPYTDFSRNNESNMYEDLQQHYDLDYNNQRSERVNKNTHGGSIHSDRELQNYTLMRYNDFNEINRNNCTDWINTQDDSYKNFKKFDDGHSNNIHNNSYNWSYNLEQNGPTNYNYNQIDAQNMELICSQQNLWHHYGSNYIGY